MPLLALRILMLAGAAAAAWWSNDALERRGLKAPGRTAPGVAVTSLGTGVAVGVMVAGGAALYLLSSRGQ